MPQSLKARFNGNAQEAVEYTRLWGRQRGFFHYKEKGLVKDWIAWVKFLDEETRDPNFGMSSTLGGTGNNNWAEDILDAFVRKINQMEAEKQSLTEELHRLRIELEYHKSNQAIRIEPKVSQVMELCKA